MFKTKRQNESEPFAVQYGRFEKLNSGYRERWSDDFLIGKDSTKGSLRKNFDFGRLKFFSVGLIFALALIVGRTAWLQIVKGDYYFDMAEGNRVRVERIEAKRGVIYDRNYNPLVRNIANFMLYVVPSDLPAEEPEKRTLAGKIAGILNVEAELIFSIINSVDRNTLEAYQPLYVADNIPYEMAMKLEILSSGEKGVVLSGKTRREYNLYCNSMSHILGYTGKISPEELKKYGASYMLIDYVGKSGVEYFWEAELRGRDGKKQIEVDALGKEKKILGEEQSQDGHNLVLSVDLAVQKKLEEILAVHLKKSNLSRASAIVMDPNDGQILSMISLPAYDDNAFARGITSAEYNKLLTDPNKPLFNRAIAGEFPSGSVIKPVIAAAALQEKIISQNTSILSSGGVRVGQWFFPDWKAGGHGSTNVRKALAESVNTFFYYIGGGFDNFDGLGVDRIVKYGKMFGLGSQVGIDLAGESTGFLPTKEWKEKAKGEPWYIGDTYHMAIGQGDILVTPLQVAVYTSAFANGGKIVRPHLIRQVLTGSDQLMGNIVADTIRDTAKENLISAENIEIIREGMRQTVTSGSARSLQSLPVTAAGKTGTAQWSTQKPPHAWFTGWAPYDDPELAITILVEEGGGGDVMAVPIAKEFLEWYYNEYKKKGNNEQPDTE